MKIAPKPANEAARLEYLRHLEILDTVAEETLDDVTRIAAQVCGTPIALISLVDEERQWFKSKVGLDVDETPRDVAFCSHAILENSVLVVEDALRDERFHDNPLVTGGPKVRFYAGAPLITDTGLGLGTVCVIDEKPRQLDPRQLESLRGLGRLVLRQLDLRLLLGRVRRLDELKDEFIATVNHELRTPLTSIRGSLALINSGKISGRPTSDAGRLLDVAERNSLQLLSLVDELLDMQKIEAGEMELVLETVDLGEIVRSALELNAGYAAAHDCTVTWRAPAAALPVAADRGRILQVLANLLSNAAKFSPAGGEIRVEHEVAAAGDAVRLAVVDRGPGIPAVSLDRVFDKFTQVRDSGATSVKGTGLGLAICKQLVEMHGGTVGVESTVGEGSTFYFELPLAPVGASSAS